MSEFICGIKPSMEGLKIEPCLPDCWNEIKATRKFRGEKYEILFKRTGERKLVCDGEEVSILPLNGKKEHKVICTY